MFVEWDPETGEDKQTWNFDPDDVGRVQGELIEKHWGEGSYDQWLQALQLGQLKARAVLLWHMISQVHPKYKYQDVPDFKIRQLRTESGVGELKKLWKRAQRTKLSADQREAFEAQFEWDMRDAMEREGMTGDFTIIDGKLEIEGAADLPKAASPSNDESFG